LLQAKNDTRNRSGEHKMPIYEYVCDDCGQQYERIVMNQSTKVTCPKCASAKNTLQLSVFAAPANGSKSSSGSGGPAPSGGCGPACGCH
jgi:putative FmdB family regulatory protein